MLDTTIRLILILVAASVARGEVPYRESEWDFKLTLPDGWGRRVLAAGTEAKMLGPVGDPSVSLIVSTMLTEDRAPLDAASLREAARKAIAGTVHEVEEVPFEGVEIPGLALVPLGFDLEMKEGTGQSIRQITFKVPLGVQDILFQIQASFPKDRGGSLEPVLREVLSSFRVAQVHRDEKDIVDAHEQDECFINQKVLAGAFELWALDKSTKWTEITPQGIAELKPEFLEVDMDDPGQGKGTSGNYYHVESGNHVACRVHGSADGNELGTKPPPDEVPDPPLDFCLYRAMTGEVAKANCEALVKKLGSALGAHRAEVDPDPELSPELLPLLLEEWMPYTLTTEDPGEGPGSEKNFTSTAGIVSCSKHGTRSE